MNISGASLSSELPPSLPSQLFLLFVQVGPCVFICGTLARFLCSCLRILKSKIEIMIFRVNPETTNKTLDYYCLFLFHPLLFVQLLRFLSRLFPAATLPISVIFMFLLSGFWSFESPLSSVSHHPPCRCVAAAMVGSETAIAKLSDHLWPTFIRLISLLTQTSCFFVQSNAVKGGKTGNWILGRKLKATVLERRDPGDVGNGCLIKTRGMSLELNSK